VAIRVETRLDLLIVARELAESRERAQSLILAGRVLVNGQKLTKCGASVVPDAQIQILGDSSRYASRAGYKLEGALAFFTISLKDQVCMDIGSSTGGFTDCLLQHGARKVFAVDVGTNQLDWRIRQNPRVICLEKTNARYLCFEHIGERVGLVTMDVSFISATLILPVVPQFLESGGEVLVLVKPQFEAGRGKVGKGGVVRDPEVQQEAVLKVSRKLVELGFSAPRSLESALPGACGNREFFLYAVWP
jgi:23S rRNA (cytidine1920-2'-O)/16S rRNA (cytidine1409-2'-O)-methyltransferase